LELKGAFIFILSTHHDTLAFFHGLFPTKDQKRKNLK